MPTRPSRSGILLILLFLAGLAWLLWPHDIAALRRRNPKTTALIERRERQAREAGRRPRTRRIWRPLARMSPHLVHAVVLAEDGRFYRHRGFDLERMRDAARANWRKGRFAHGASTITMQLARNLYLSPSKNLLRKAREAILTVYLERTLSKKRILELYLNVAEWGNELYGAEAAAQAYFGKAAEELTPDEAVALVSILPSPRRWSPFSEKAFMARRRTRLYERMQQAGYIPPEEENAEWGMRIAE